MIKKLVKRITHIVANLFSLDQLIDKSNHHIILPFYHSVTDDKPVHIRNLYQPRSIESFKADLDFLLEHYQSISLEELIQLNVSEENIAKNYFHLTFDDGLSEFYDIVAPILKERGVHATVFLNSNFIDNKKLFYRFKASILYDKLKVKSILSIPYNNRKYLDELALTNKIDFDEYLKEKTPYLSSEQINELIKQGFTFGAHSKNHPLYSDLELEEQLSQTKESIKAISSQFKLAYKVFSFPFTDYGVSKKFFDAIYNETDLTFGCAGLKLDSAKDHLQRLAMETSKSGKEIIKEEYLYYLMKAMAGKNKITRQ